MSFNTITEDVRSIKTKKALYEATLFLLKKNSFKKITIKEICEKAFISRAAFYAHFIDKYDLLQHWLGDLYPVIIDESLTYEQKEEKFNYYIRENGVVLKNLFYEADNETFLILYKFILSTINLTMEKKESEENIVIANFYAGGIISYLLWQVKNNFPKDIPPMNTHFCEVLNELKKWKLKQDNKGEDFK